MNQNVQSVAVRTLCTGGTSEDWFDLRHVSIQTGYRAILIINGLQWPARIVAHLCRMDIRWKPSCWRERFHSVTVHLLSRFPFDPWLVND